MSARSLLLSLLVVTATLAGCTTSRPYSLEPIPAREADDRPIEKPDEKEEHFRWDALYLSTFYRLERLLDLNRAFNRVARAMGADAYDEADNLNALDEPPESSWYRYRHFYDRMSEQALRRGPNTVPGPDVSGALTIIGGKSEGVNPGFFARDGRGDVYLFKLDDPHLPELSSASEVIATKIYYAAGYFVPENNVVYFRPEQLVLDDGAEMSDDGQDRLMTCDDVEEILAKTSRTADGQVRALASKFVDGEPLGIWEFRGVRDDDPNDRVAHEQRRELRGLSVLAAWLQDADRRDGNTLAVYTGDGYVRHYLLDMGSTLGTGSTSLRNVKKGHEYRYDVGAMLTSFVTLGLRVKPWMEDVGDSTSFYPSVGYFESEHFDPGEWVPTYPNPAFDHVTPRDGFWGAKMVMSFTDEDLSAIIDEARISNPEARAYLTRILRERRDKIGRYWFSQVNPLDRFRLVSPTGSGDPLASRAGAVVAPVPYHLRFDDLAVESGLAAAEATSYRYRVRHAGGRLVGEAKTARTLIPLPAPETPRGDRVLEVTIWTARADDFSPPVRVYVHLPDDGTARVAGIVRGS